MDAPVVAVSSDGKIGAAWMDTRAGGGNRDVQWTMGQRGTFAAEKRANDESDGIQGHPSLAFDGKGTLWCVWEDARAGADKQRIYAADFGTKQNVQVSADSEGKCAFPSLAAGGDVLGVAYETPAGISFRAVGR
ncbi:MAG TPA: hypothetical protein VFD82_19750 [Planctomycetota bacterium]|nr:hypothetical protein [Planctomycetota bacterium]